MPDRTEYETGARRPIEKTQPDENEKFSQNAAANKAPSSRPGNSEPMRDSSGKTRDSRERAETSWQTAGSASRKMAGIDPTSSQVGDAAKGVRRPGAYARDGR